MAYEEYQINLRAAPAQKVFLNLRPSLIDRCELSRSFFEKIKDFLYQEDIIKQGEQQNQQCYRTILNHFTSPLLSAEVQQKLIEKFLCVVYADLSREYRSAFLESIQSAIKTTLGTPEVAVFTRISTSINQSDQGETASVGQICTTMANRSYLNLINSMPYPRQQQILRRITPYVCDRAISPTVLRNITTVMFSLSSITSSEQQHIRDPMELINILYSRPEGIFGFLNHIVNLEPFQVTIWIELEDAIRASEPEPNQADKYDLC